jgi:hypothetical protein
MLLWIRGGLGKTEEGECHARSWVLVHRAPRCSGPPGIRAAAIITQELRRTEGSWRITRRTVAPAAVPR